MKFLFFLPLLLSSLPPLSPKDLAHVGQRVWQNEADGKVEGLTAWNTGEQFASLGIGHFIWYPTAAKGPFEESFPSLVAFLRKEGVSLPTWLTPEMRCPWPDRTAFLADFNGARMKELRTLLASTIAQQSQFLANRLDRALPEMLNAAPPAQRDLIEKNYQKLAATSSGRFALIDYVNFKGEGTKPTEKYQGQGWGLLQVLEAMPANGSASEFGKAAGEILTRRVKNAPPERHEERWLPGWLNRVKAY
ncbi:MAG: hypothetical protein WCO60_07535 [Verrucomicrobiota bacterium]